MITQFFRRLFLADHGPAPRPNVTQLPAFNCQRIVETVYSDATHSWRAHITVDDTGDYRVHIEHWDTSDWKAYGKAFWLAYNTGCHTNLLENARELAGLALGMPILTQSVKC